MVNETAVVKTSKVLQIPLKSSNQNHVSENPKPLVNPMSAAQQVKIVHRLITFFETK